MTKKLALVTGALATAAAGIAFGLDGNTLGLIKSSLVHTNARR